MVENSVNNSNINIHVKVGEKWKDLVQGNAVLLSIFNKLDQHKDIFDGSNTGDGVVSQKELNLWMKIQQEYRNFFNKSEEDSLDLNFINDNLVVENDAYVEKGYVARKDKSGNFVLTLNSGYKMIISKKLLQL